MHAPAGRLVEVGAAAHGFGAGADGHFAVAQGDGLGRGDDGLQARAAQAVDVEGRGFDGAARIDGGHTGQIGIARVGGDDIAHDHMADQIGGNACARYSGLDHSGGQLGVGDVLEAAAKGADGRARCADDEDVSGCHSLTLGKIYQNRSCLRLICIGFQAVWLILQPNRASPEHQLPPAGL